MSSGGQNSAIESLQNIIRQKDLKIKELESQLLMANIKIQQLQSSQQKKRFQKLASSSNSGPEDIQVTNKTLPFPLKESLDTAHIAQINSSLNSIKSTAPDFSEFRLKIPKLPEDPLKGQNKAQHFGHSKVKSNNTFENLSSKLEDIIFSGTVDKNTWEGTLNNLRNDPSLMSKALKGAKVAKARESLTRQARSRKSDPLPQPEYPRTSCKIMSSSYEKKWQEIDWSQTVLDTYVSKNLLEFNFLRDGSILSPYEIEDIQKNVTGPDNWETVYSKCLKTLDKLSSELMLPRGFFIIPPRSPDSIDALLQECAKLFRARALVMKILGLIHKREDLLLKIMRFDEEDESLKKDFEAFTQISQDVLQSIGFLSQVGLNLAEFVYLGGNYAQKILQDDKNIKELFPGLKNTEEY